MGPHRCIGGGGKYNREGQVEGPRLRGEGLLRAPPSHSQGGLQLSSAGTAPSQVAPVDGRLFFGLCSQLFSSDKTRKHTIHLKWPDETNINGKENNPKIPKAN